MLFILKELETGTSDQAFQCVLSHGFAHPQQPKSRSNWKIRGPAMVGPRVLLETCPVLGLMQFEAGGEP